MKPQFLERGFTLIETLVGVSVFAIIAVAVYQGYTAWLLYTSPSPRD